MGQPAMPMAVVALFATAATLATNARATPSARLVYARSADAASCPDELSLHKAVGARFGYDPFFAWARQTVVVQIWRDRQRYSARVQVVDDQGVEHGSREITSDERGCSELFGAVALAISIALDASASVAPTPDALPPDPSPPVTLESPAPAAPSQSVSGVSPPPPARAPVAPVNGLRALPMEARSQPWAMGIDALGAGGLSIDAAPGLAAFAARRSGSLSVGAELQIFASFPSSAPAGHIVSGLLIAVLAPCFHLGRAFACALGELGWQEAWGSGVQDARSAGTAFAAAGGRLGVELPLSSRFFFRIHVDGLVDFNPATFELDLYAWGAPPFAVVGGVGAGWLFL
jgi:hypothetical protein